MTSVETKHYHFYDYNLRVCPECWTKDLEREKKIMICDKAKKLAGCFCFPIIVICLFAINLWFILSRK